MLRRQRILALKFNRFNNCGRPHGATLCFRAGAATEGRPYSYTYELGRRHAKETCAAGA